MISEVRSRVKLGPSLEPIRYYLLRPVRLFKTYDRQNLRQDVMAGLTVAVILLPQAIAFTLIAELPVQMGLYSAIVAAIFAALWGSSDQTHTGPANAISLLVLSALLAGSFEPGTNEFILAAGLMAVMVGIFQLTMGLARLGVLINFVSHSVVVGFANGAGVLIAVRQIRPLLGLQFESGSLAQTLVHIVRTLPSLNPETTAIGIGTIFLILVLRRVNRRLPGALIAMVCASAVVGLLGLSDRVDVIGELPKGLPPLASLPLFNQDFISRLSTGALAVGAIGLVETMAIARSIATQTGQRLDSNQEFVGQGIANIASGFLSGYPGAGSFSRSAVNASAGAKTPVASIFSSAFVLVAMFTLGSFAAFLPKAALAGVLVVVVAGMIDGREIRRIWQGARGDAVIMLVTFFGTLFIEIAFAVLLGILLSFALYIIRTSMPRVHAVVPDEDYKHFAYRPDLPTCPQLGIIDVLGDLYFGAVNHVEEIIQKILEENPEQRFLLLRMHNVNNCDFSGVHMLENLVRVCRDRGGDLFLVRVSYRVDKLLTSTGFCDYLGRQNILSEDTAIQYLFYHELDPVVCIYECPVRVFKECQNLPKHFYPQATEFLPQEVLTRSTDTVSPQELHDRLAAKARENRPLVIDVREPREFRRGRIPQAKSEPLPGLLAGQDRVPNDKSVVLVCRTGRRSRMAAQLLQERGLTNISILEGGMLAWERAQFLAAIDEHAGVEDG